MTRNVLFLCTGNSARSIMAEALLNHWGRGSYWAFSAGSHPTGTVNPYALQLLKQKGIPCHGARSKSWDEFAQPGAPDIGFIFTVCDAAASETCPIWPGHPTTAHWGVQDPAAVEGDDATKAAAFERAFDVLEHRIKLFVSLPYASLGKARLREIGASLPGG